MYSAARSKRLGIDHSPLVELSGVVGGIDPMVGVMLADTGMARLFIDAVAALGFIYLGAALDARWPVNAAASFSRARSVLVKGLAHCAWVSTATDAGTGSVVLSAVGFAGVVFVVPEMELKVVRSADMGSLTWGQVSKTFSALARSAIMCFSCCNRFKKWGSDLDSSMTANRKMALMARCKVIQDRAACRLMLCISMYASTVVIRLLTQSLRMLDVVWSLVSAGDLSAGRQSSDAK